MAKPASENKGGGKDCHVSPPFCKAAARCLWHIAVTTWMLAMLLTSAILHLENCNLLRSTGLAKCASPDPLFINIVECSAFQGLLRDSGEAGTCFGLEFIESCIYMFRRSNCLFLASLIKRYGIIIRRFKLTCMFSIILSCLSWLRYFDEWRVAAGFGSSPFVDMECLGRGPTHMACNVTENSLCLFWDSASSLFKSFMSNGLHTSHLHAKSP
ncbi:hypothetical protein F5B21DRAFT_483372 [Xylaria acuta]|nr:hypothetical protein F5B21DRAFT_483372 [Xylaria acuta]